MSNKVKHLEFIQAVIGRMASNSFLLKGWSLTVLGGMFALAGQSNVPDYIFVAVIIILGFWALDGYYLCAEKRYRAFYNEVRRKDEKDIDFAMELTPTCKEEAAWFGSARSDTLLMFYMPLMVAILLLLIFTSYGTTSIL